MRTIAFSIFIITIAVLAVPAQRSGSLPSAIADYEDSYALLSDPVVSVRLRALMERSALESFLESFETVTPIVRRGDWIFASGCLIHACTHIESAIAIDIKNNSIHVAIFREESPTRYFNERKRKTPKIIAEWETRLRDLRRNTESGEAIR